MLALLMLCVAGLGRCHQDFDYYTTEYSPSTNVLKMPWMMDVGQSCEISVFTQNQAVSTWEVDVMSALEDVATAHAVEFHAKYNHEYQMLTIGKRQNGAWDHSATIEYEYVHAPRIAYDDYVQMVTFKLDFVEDGIKLSLSVDEFQAEHLFPHTGPLGRYVQTKPESLTVLRMLNSSHESDTQIQLRPGESAPRGNAKKLLSHLDHHIPLEIDPYFKLTYQTMPMDYPSNNFLLTTCFIVEMPRHDFWMIWGHFPNVPFNDRDVGFAFHLLQGQATAYARKEGMGTMYAKFAPYKDPHHNEYCVGLKSVKRSSDNSQVFLLGFWPATAESEAELQLEPFVSVFEYGHLFGYGIGYSNVGLPRPSVIADFSYEDEDGILKTEHFEHSKNYFSMDFEEKQYKSFATRFKEANGKHRPGFDDYFGN